MSGKRIKVCTQQNTIASKSMPLLRLTVGREWHVNVVDHETSNRHLALLNQLLYSKDYMQLAKKAEEEDAHSFLKDKHRRERLLLAEGLKKQHERDLKAEIKAINKTVNDMRDYVQRTMNEVKPVALDMAVKEFLRLASNSFSSNANKNNKRKRFAMHGDEDDGDDDGNDDDKKHSQSLSSSLSPPRLQKDGIHTPPQRPIKRKARAYTSAAGGGDDGEQEEAMEAMMKGALNLELMKRQFQETMNEAQREKEEELQTKWNDQMNRRVRVITEAIKEEMKESFDIQLEEEKERARVMMEVEHDLEKKDLEAKIRAECQQEIASIMKKVGFQD